MGGQLRIGTAMSLLNPVARGALPFVAPADILDRLEQSVQEGRFSGGVYEVVVAPSDEPGYRSMAASEGTLRLKKKRPYLDADLTLRLVGDRLEYEIGYAGLRRQNIQLVLIFAGLITLASAIVAIWNPPNALRLGFALGGVLVFMVALARFATDVGEPLVRAVAEEIRSAKLEERIRNEVRRELRYRVVSEEETPPDLSARDQTRAPRARSR
jgi:hypothetical protein